MPAGHIRREREHRGCARFLKRIRPIWQYGAVQPMIFEDLRQVLLLWCGVPQAVNRSLALPFSFLHPLLIFYPWCTMPLSQRRYVHFLKMCVIAR